MEDKGKVKTLGEVLDECYDAGIFYREKAIRDIESLISQARAEGYAEGKAEGARELAEKLNKINVSDRGFGVIPIKNEVVQLCNLLDEIDAIRKGGSDGR